MELVQHLEASEGLVWSVVFRPGRDHDLSSHKELAAQRHGKVIKNKIAKTVHYSLKLTYPLKIGRRPQEGRLVFQPSREVPWLSGRFLRFREGKIQKIHGTTSPMT